MGEEGGLGPCMNGVFWEIFHVIVFWVALKSGRRNRNFSMILFRCEYILEWDADG